MRWDQVIEAKAQLEAVRHLDWYVIAWEVTHETLGGVAHEEQWRGIAKHYKLDLQANLYTIEEVTRLCQIAQGMADTLPYIMLDGDERPLAVGATVRLEHVPTDSYVWLYKRLWQVRARLEKGDVRLRAGETVITEESHIWCTIAALPEPEPAPLGPDIHPDPRDPFWQRQ